ncbi:uncharacterized protein N7443_000732 [Penicillium atrosanguineum]|uniref:uncharacterized protein n=1 Tax=Penicillium atrosanguineum TaxID=1132637 RepID=UPI0023A4A4BA|nr:uncharacterized protein N7443_000732 [Penicillium atrosanguineum]KAJ5313848.1 hypothetical protein N7443_000732 [Penicillium atrosanguineum]
MSSDEEDYMSMAIEEPKQKETFTQRKKREQREAEARGKVPSKAERAAEDARRRDEALATSTLDPSNKGFKMMAKLGFKPGQSLGKRDTDADTDTKISGPDDSKTRSEPLNLVFKENRGGIGLDTEKKRKIREEAAEAIKKIKHEEGDYRDRVREERELKRIEAQIRAAQKVAERLDAEAEEDTGKDGDQESKQEYPDANNKDEAPEDNELGPRDAPKPKRFKPTSQVNILYRGLVREREERERDNQARHALMHSLPSSFFPSQKLPGYEDADLERDDKQALGDTLGPYTAAVEQELEEEDPELDAFNALDPAERLHKLVVYLRDTYRYCFWCKYRYETDVELEGCPGLTEEDHD